MPLSEGSISRIPIFVRLHALEDSKAAPGAPERLGIYVYLTDENGKLADYFTRLATIDPKRDGGRSKDGVTFYGMCRAVPGSYRARVYVRDEATGRYAFRVVPVTVAQPADGDFEVLPPVFLDNAARGLFMRDQSAGGAEPEPFQIGGEVVTPTLAPVLAPDGHARVCVFLYHAQPGKADSPFQISAEVVDGNGRGRSPALVKLIGRSAPDPRGLTKLLFDFSPAGLPEGEYSLRVRISDSGDARLSSQNETKFHVS